MRHVILGLLLHGPLSLYDLHKHFTRGVSLFYSASYGSLQRALDALVTAGHVARSDASTGGRRRTLHTITGAGREAWRAWMLEPVTGGQPETVMLAKVFFLDGLPEDERAEVVARIGERVEADLAALRATAAGIDADVEAMTGDGGIPAGASATIAFRRATLDYGVRSHELALRWLSELAELPGVTASGTSSPRAT